MGGICDTAVAAGNFKTLVAATEAAGLVETLNTKGPYTVFAPTDEAFAKLPEGTVENLLKDKEKLTAILTYHVIEGAVPASDVTQHKKLTTLQGQDLDVSQLLPLLQTMLGGGEATVSKTAGGLLDSLVGTIGGEDGLDMGDILSAGAAFLQSKQEGDSNLEAAVEDYINRLRKDGKLDSDERTGWSVYDFTTGEKLVTINEDQQFQAASLVKPFIAAAFFYKVEQGELKYGRESRRQMERMIQHSNNASTNWVTRMVGGPRAVQRILKQQYPGIFQEIHLVEYIPAGGKTYRNKASVHDYSRFLYALWKENIVGAREIKRLMVLPGPDRIYTGVRAVPKGTKVYNKTGSTARVCGDMGILNVKGSDGKWYPYTVIGIIEKEQNATNYTSWIRSRGNIIRDVSGIVYQSIARNHNI